MCRAATIQRTRPLALLKDTTIHRNPTLHALAVLLSAISAASDIIPSARAQASDADEISAGTADDCNGVRIDLR